MKPADQLSVSDFANHRVWEFADDLETELPDETYMRPVAELPVRSLSGRVVGTGLTLANGQELFAVLGNIDLTNPVSTEHFLTVTVFRHSGEKFDLGRYHDVDYSRQNPAALCAFLGLPEHAVFPMQYDITDVAVGHPDCLRRKVSAVPASRLRNEELIDLAVNISTG